MGIRTAGLVGAVCLLALGSGCTDQGMLQLRQMQAQLARATNPVPDKPLNEKCPIQESINAWTDDCVAWMKQRDAAARMRRQADETARQAAAVRLLAQQQEQERESRERERAAMQEDERQGYKNMSFDEFILDAKTMQGRKVVLKGIYVERGQRLVRDHLSAVRWIQYSDFGVGVLIPLQADDAPREARALLLQCGRAVTGCPLVVRGRIKELTLRNGYGVQSRQFGLVVEGIR